MAERRPLAVGDVVHGFAHGVFGRDHYGCCAVEHVAADWAVFRGIGNGPTAPCDDGWWGDAGDDNATGGVSFSTALAELAVERDTPDYSHCSHGDED